MDKGTQFPSFKTQKKKKLKGESEGVKKRKDHYLMDIREGQIHLWKQTEK